MNNEITSVISSIDFTTARAVLSHKKNRLSYSLQAGPQTSSTIAGFASVLSGTHPRPDHARDQMEWNVMEHHRHELYFNVNIFSYDS